MTNSSSAHDWVNTGIAAVALIAAGVSSYLSWLDHQAKKDSISITGGPTGACHVRYHHGEQSGQLGFCWKAILANTSENRLSIVDYRILNGLGNGPGFTGSGNELFGSDEKPLSLPSSLDGGEPKAVLVRSVIPVPAAVAHVIEALPEYHSNSLGALFLIDLQNKLADAGLDLVDNTVTPLRADDKVQGWNYPDSSRKLRTILHVETGRGASFDGHMEYLPARRIDIAVMPAGSLAYYVPHEIAQKSNGVLSTPARQMLSRMSELQENLFGLSKSSPVLHNAPIAITDCNEISGAVCSTHRRRV